MEKRRTLRNECVRKGLSRACFISFSICAVWALSGQAQNRPAGPRDINLSPVHAKPLFEIFTNDGSLPAAATARLQKFSRSRKSKKVNVVRLPADLYNYWEFGLNVDPRTEALLFDKSGTGLVVSRTGLEILSDEEIAWTGTILHGAAGEEVGDVTLIQNREGAVTGTIDLEGTFYEIRPLGRSNLHAVRLVDTGYMKDLYKENDVIRGPSPGDAGYDRLKTIPEYKPGSFDTIQGTRCSPEYQRLLVLYTPRAAQDRDINGIISLAVQEANESYGNSQVNNLRIAVAHKRQISFSESSDIRSDLIKLRSNSTVQNLLNQYKADVVMLLTDGNYGSTIGRADALLANQGTAFAIVQADYAVGPDYTFPHELGHLQGAQHHPEDPIDPNGPFSYGFGHRFSYKPSIFVSRRRRATVMAYPFTPVNAYTYHRRKHFSNPNVEYGGADTGIPNLRKNGGCCGPPLPLWPISGMPTNCARVFPGTRAEIPPNTPLRRTPAGDAAATVTSGASATTTPTVLAGLLAPGKA